MIGDVLAFLRKQLDARLSAEIQDGSDEPSSEKVVFMEGDRMDPIAFKIGAVSLLLINVEEERILRNADRYARKAEDGTLQRGQPDLRLILYVLFVARFKQYDAAWQHLSKIIEHLQHTRAFERASHATLPAGVERLSMELMTLRFSEQNEIWSALRTTYHPSILYRVNLLVLRDRAPETVGRVEEQEIRLERIS